jgi:excisionase family DNA binding protein
MVQGFYTLEEAAQILGMSADELKQLSKRGELRAFQDRGSLRFRTSEVEELARQRGQRSDPDLPLGEAPHPRPTDSPAPKASPPPGTDVFDFSLDLGDEQVQLGQEVLGETPSGRRKTSSKSDPKKGPPSPAPKPGSDSDVRLVAEGSDLDVRLAGDSDVKIGEPGSKPPGTSSKSGSPSPKPRRRTGAHMDSAERLVGLDSDSDVKIVGVDDSAVGRKPPKSGTDSDVRLEKGTPRRDSDDALLTEEIDLDAEIRKAEEAAKEKSDPKSKTLPKAKQPEFPTTSPFELSDADEMKVDLPKPAAGKGKDRRSPSSSDMLLVPQRGPDSSSDFDLTPAAQDQSPIELGSDEFQLEVADEGEVGLGDLPAVKGRDSGINLRDPKDSGISLEQAGDGSDEIEFELSLDAESTPKPAPAAEADSDSEFELTIDESGGLAPVEQEAAAPEKDIFETDFDVPALEDESGSQAMALDESDSDLDSSDFDIALSDADMAAEEESGSQVVALDEEEAEAGAATVQRPAPKKKTVLLPEADEEEGLDDLMGVAGEAVVEEELEEEEAPALVGAAPAPVEWGAWSLLLLPCVLVLLLVGMLAFELLQGMTGYHKPGLLTSQLAKILKAPLPKD